MLYASTQPCPNYDTRFVLICYRVSLLGGQTADQGIYIGGKMGAHNHSWEPFMTGRQAANLSRGIHKENGAGKGSRTILERLLNQKF